MTVKIEFSPKLSKFLDNFKENKVVQTLFSLRDNGTDIANLVEGNNYVNYLNLKEDLTISYIKVSSIERNKVTDPWHKSRQHCSLTQVISRILNNNHIMQLQKADAFKQTDIEKLNAMFSAHQMKDLTVEVLKGFDILQGYNYTSKLDVKKIQSCANFHQPVGGHAEPKVKWFHVYIYNEGCRVLVVKDKDGSIKARAAYFEGIQQEDSGTFKKGDFIKYLNNIYSETQTHAEILKNYCIQNDILMNCKDTGKGTIVIPFNCKFKTWPPIDGINVDPSKNLLFNKFDTFGNKYKLQSAYKLVLNGGNHSVSKFDILKKLKKA